MSSILLTGPAAEPLSLDEAKAYLRVAHDDDDDLIAALIDGARHHVEARTRRALITQTWRINCDAWPADGRIAVLPAPLRELAAARVYDEAGEAQAIDLQAFVVDTISVPGVVSFAPWSVPGPGREQGGIELDMIVGYGDAAGDVPTPLRLAIRLLLAHWYENRGIVTAGAAPLPASVAEVIAPYRVLSL
ncbi:MAG: hypothetical protein GEU91_00740 [Rhizobiales bacterium]|nr:hypothetical protein [Hyphomicrobiales bacterium]